MQKIIRKHQKLGRGFVLGLYSFSVPGPGPVAGETAMLQTQPATAAMGALQSGACTGKMSILLRIAPETKLIMLYYCKPRNV